MSVTAEAQRERRRSFTQGGALVVAMTVAFGLDYLFSVLSGRMLGQEEYGILTALAGIGQVMVIGSRVIQTVVTRYVARFDERGQTARFFWGAMRSAVWGGLILTVIGVGLSVPIARFLRIESVWTAVALMITTFLLVVRPVVGGTLQGDQRFGLLGVIQIVQAAGRLVVGVGLIGLGLGAFGGMVALPIGSGVALLFGLLTINLARRHEGTKEDKQVEFSELFRYSATAAAGLIGFALLINMDAILVRRFFDGEAAGNYATAVTLGKVIQFFPLAIIMILFPKSAKNHAEQRGSRWILAAGLGLVGVICGGVAAVYFAVPDQWLITLIFGDEYAIGNNLLGWIGLAMVMLSLVNVVLNYALAVELGTVVWVIWAGVIGQAVGMFMWHDTLIQLPIVMAVTGGIVVVLGVMLAIVRGSYAPEVA